MATVYDGTGTRVARLPGIQPHLDAYARQVLLAAQTRAAASVDTGAYLSSLSAMAVPGESGVTDRYVYSSDPAAAPIEYGHMTRGRSPQWVPGKYILTGALGAVAGG